jgi:hypothetical protein
LEEVAEADEASGLDPANDPESATKYLPTADTLAEELTMFLRSHCLHF